MGKTRNSVPLDPLYSLSERRWHETKMVHGPAGSDLKVFKDGEPPTERERELSIHRASLSGRPLILAWNNDLADDRPVQLFFVGRQGVVRNVEMSYAEAKACLTENRS